jgi:hypothetical protein
MIEFVRIAFTMDDGSLNITSFVTRGRGNRLPPGAVWINRDIGAWAREPTKSSINDLASQIFVDRLDDDGILVVTPKPVSFRVVEDGEIPSVGTGHDKRFRAAWTDDAGKISVEMVKAREITLDAIRNERMKVMPGLDIAWSVAMAKGDMEMAASVEAQRQALRDITATLAPAINAATTPEELKALINIT